MIKLGNINLSANPRIHFGLQELLHHLSSGSEFNVVYLSETTVFTRAEIYDTGVLEDDEPGGEGGPRPDYIRKLHPQGNRLSFLVHDFLTSGTKVVDGSLFYGNLLVRLSDVISLLKKWEDLELAYSNGVSELRKIFDSELREGKQWVAFFNRDVHDPLQENTARKEIKLWYDIDGTELGKVVREGLSKVDPDRVLEEVENAINSPSFFLDLQIKRLVVERTKKKPEGGATVGFDSVFSFDYEGKVPKISKDSFKSFLNFNEELKRGIPAPAQKVLAFFDFIEKPEARSPEVRRYKEKYLNGPNDYFWELENRVYLDSGAVHLQPETYTIYLPGKCSSTICLNLKRVLYREEESPQAEVGVVFVGLLDHDLDDLESSGEGDYITVTLVFVPYVATKQKLALSAVPVEIERSTDLSKPPVITGYSLNEPCGVSVHLFERDKVNRENEPSFKVVYFTRGEIVETNYDKNNKTSSLSTYSPSPIMEVIVPDKNKIHYSRTNYFDLDLIYSMYLLDYYRDGEEKRKIVDIVKRSYPLAIKNINLPLKNQKDAKWSAGGITHTNRLMLLKKFKENILRSIDDLVKSSIPLHYENRRSEDWQYAKNLCFKGAGRDQKVEIDLGEVSKYELYRSPTSLLFSRISHYQGTNRLGEVRPAEVLKDIVEFGFDGKEKEVLGSVYRIIEALGRNGESDENDFFTLLSKRTKDLIKYVSEIGEQGGRGPKCTLVFEYQPTIFINSPYYAVEDSSEETLSLLMTSLYLAIDLEESGLGVIVGIL